MFHSHSAPNLAFASHQESETASHTSATLNEASNELCFQQKFDLFYRQLTVGCGRGSDICQHKLCKSSIAGSSSTTTERIAATVLPSSPNTAYVMAMQLASRRPFKYQMICPILLAAMNNNHSVSERDRPHSTPEETSEAQLSIPIPFSSPPVKKELALSKFISRKDSLIAQHPRLNGMSAWQRAKSMLDLPSLFAASTTLERSESSLPRQLTENNLTYHTPLSSLDSSPTPSRTMSRSQSRDSLLAPSSLSHSRDSLLMDGHSDYTFTGKLTLQSFIEASDLDHEESLSTSHSHLGMLVKNLFSSQEALCSAFLFESSTLNNAFYTSGESHIILGVDVTQVREMYGILSFLDDNESFLLIYISALELALARLEATVRNLRLDNANVKSLPSFNVRRNTSNLASVSRKLRQFVIILESPLLAKHTNFDVLTRRFISLLSKLRKEIKAVLVRNLALGYSHDEEHFGKLTGTVRSFMFDAFHDNPTVDDSVVCAVRTLSFLFNVNEASAQYRSHIDIQSTLPLVSTSRTIVPYTEFYCTLPLKEHGGKNPLAAMSWKDEYPKWLNLQQYPDLSRSTFSFLNYPFLFDPIAKNRILRLESLGKMSAWFESAFVHHAFVATAKKVAGGFSGVNHWNEEHAEEITSPITPVDPPRNTQQLAQPAESDYSQDEAEVIEPSSDTLTRIETAFQKIVSPYLVLEIRREHLVEDALEQLEQKKQDLHKPLKIKFIANGEEGVDQGGVQTEFFQLILQKLLDPAYDLFVYEADVRLCWINGHSMESVRFFQLFGMILGLAVYNGVMVDIKFPDVFFKKLLHNSSSDVSIHWNHEDDLDDIAELYPELFRGLRQLQAWDDERDGGSVEDVFCRNFEISYNLYDKVKTVSLVDGGDQMPVTSVNRDTYIKLYVQNLLDTSVAKQLKAIRTGFWRVVGSPGTPSRVSQSSRQRVDVKTAPCYALRLFRPEELHLLLTGLSADIDSTLYSAESFLALKVAATYEEYTPRSIAIILFWAVVLEDFTDDQRRKLLWFVTSSDRVPLGGFKELTFCIQKNGGDGPRLPTALTCFGRLLLPEYSSRERMHKMLSMAVVESQGFGLL